MDSQTALEPPASSPALPDSGEPELSLSPDLARSLAPELLAKPPTAEPPPPGQTEPPPQAPTPEEELDQYVTVLTDSDGGRITEIPRQRQAEAVKAYIGRLYTAANEALAVAYQRGMEAGKAQLSVAGAVSELDALIANGDMDSFEEAVQKFPGGKRGYYRAKAELTPVAPSSTEDYQARYDRIWRSRVASVSAVEQWFREHWNYAPTEQDLDRFQRDIDARILAASRATDPDAQALKQREAAAAARRETPKPEVSVGTGASQRALTEADLRRMTAQQISKVPLEELDKALAVS